ncbi:YqaA family protein [Thioclava sp. GXIMD2076]|uniref:YqaA family protein n=1 Tax=Thioclava sp. GXIMD2076 TaxID=3131931 RepID=UPI0030CB95DE
MLDLTASLAGLFFSGLLAATPIPAQSEIVFVAMQTADAAPIGLMIVIAGIGNTLGALITYYIGAGVTRWRDRKWFPASEKQLERGHRWFERWGNWLLFLSWAPGGDLICLIAGILRKSLWQFIPIVFLAKTGRYAVVALIAAKTMEIVH